jgi:predicted Zn-dependent protease
VLSDAVTVFREDAEDAVRIVSGMLRRGEGGEAFRERRRTIAWSATEAGLQSPSIVEESGTAVRVTHGKDSLLVAADGDGPEALRAVVREASRRAGGAPFFKTKAAPPLPEGRGPSGPDEEARATLIASALARALPDPRGLSMTLAIARVTGSRAVVTARGFVPCGEATRLEATGVLRRTGATRSFAFQSSAPFPAACDALTRALAEATRPVPAHRAPEGKVDVVLSPEAASVFWHEAVGHPLEAEGGERTSVLTRVARASVAPPGYFVTSDPTRRELPGSYLADDEGTPARPVPLLEDGRVAGVLTDRRTAGAETNGHGRCGDFRRPPRPRLSALTVSAGRASRDELLDACGGGLYVREISAGHADPESGRFTLFIESADLVRRGRLGAAVAPLVLTSDVLTALRNLWGEPGEVSAPASGLGLCVKRGEPLPVGGASPAILLRGLTAVPGRP